MRTIQAVDEPRDTQHHNFNWTYQEVDASNPDLGIQCFVYKRVVGDVAISRGSPVGTKPASGGADVTADQALAGSTGILGHGGGIAMFDVAAGDTKYGFVQHQGLNRYDLIVGGASTVTAGNLLVWTGTNTVNDVAAGQETLVFARALVSRPAGSDRVPAGGVLLLG